jgi:hypothetical protein
MRFTSKVACAIATISAIALTASAADARGRHVTRYGDAPYAYGGAFGAYNAYGGGSERFFGSSVPYNPDGPGWNDFQLQGKE